MRNQNLTMKQIMQENTHLLSNKFLEEETFGRNTNKRKKLRNLRHV